MHTLYTHEACSQDFFRRRSHLYLSYYLASFFPLLLSPSLSYILPFPSLSFRNRPLGSLNNQITLCGSKTDPLPLLSHTVPDLIDL